MSTVPDNEFDLEKLFLPAWAQEDPSASKYAKYEGRDERYERRGEGRGPRPPRREGRGSDRRDSRPRRGPAAPPGERPRSPGAEQDRGRDRTGRRGPPRGRPEERREPAQPLPEVTVSLVPEEKGVESLARQIKMTGRAYPLFDIAQMILQKPERYAVVFGTKKNAEGQTIQPLFVCALDDTLWLSEDEAVAHILTKHFGTFYQADRTATEPPKGKYTFVAQCGMSGIVLGPPNYHDYQNQLRKLHAERFSRMPFEVFKSRVKIVRDEEVVKKWVEEQSWKTEYLCLNMPEPLRLVDREAVEKHFRENHKENIVKSIETHSLNGIAARSLRSPGLSRLVRAAWEEQRRFPLQIATVLSQQFAGHGLQFFKVNRTITHVSVARPHYLDLTLTPVSEGVKRIVDFINANPKCSRRQLVEALAPSPPAAPIPVGADAQPTVLPAEASAPTPEQTAVIADLHWLIHQGHVIEFAKGVLECAKKPVPKPPKPQKEPENKETGTQQENAPVAGREAEIGAASGPEAVVPDVASPTGAPASDSGTGTNPPGDAVDNTHPEPGPQVEGEHPAGEQQAPPKPAAALSVDTPATPIGSTS